MKLLNLLGVALVALPTALAAPSSRSLNTRAVADDEFNYYLFVNAYVPSRHRTLSS